MYFFGPRKDRNNDILNLENDRIKKGKLNIREKRLMKVFFATFLSDTTNHGK